MTLMYYMYKKVLDVHANMTIFFVSFTFSNTSMPVYVVYGLQYVGAQQGRL